MSAILRNQLAAILGILFTLLGDGSAYPPIRNPFSSYELYDRQMVVCFISAANVQFNYDTIQPGWCTHYVLIDLIVLNSEGKLMIIEQSYPALGLLTELKSRLRQMGDTSRFILAIGGINQDSAHFSRAVSDPSRVRNVAESVAAFAMKFCFDGVDLAWFYPGKFGGCEMDKCNLVSLIREIRGRLPDGSSLSVTVGVDPRDIDLAYNVSAINLYVDFVNAMTGDFHDPEHASHVAALYPENPKDRYNIYSSMKAYVEAGFPPDKLVVLTSTYGYLYSLKVCHQRGSESVKSVQKLNNVCIREILEQESFYTMWDDVRKVPYSTLMRGSSMKWITFNDLESHRYKAEFVRKYELGGIGVFTLDQDVGECTDGIPFPFLWTLVKVIRSEKAMRVLPGAACGDVPETCPTRTSGEETAICPLKGTTVNGEDVMVRYVSEHIGNGRLKTKIYEPTDVLFQSVGVTCQPLITMQPLTTTTEVVTTTLPDTTTTDVITTTETTTDTTTTEETTTETTTTTESVISMDTQTTSTTEEINTTDTTESPVR